MGVCEMAETLCVDAGVDVHGDGAEGGKREDDDNQFDADRTGRSVAVCSAQRDDKHVDRSQDEVPEAPTLGKNKLMIR